VTTETLRLPDGYSRSKGRPMLSLRYMTPVEARELTPGAVVKFLAHDGTARHCRISGRPKVWKTQPERVEVPAKYGLYENTRFHAAEGRMVNFVGCALLVQLEPQEG